MAAPNPLIFYNIASLALECSCAQLTVLAERDDLSPSANACPCRVFVSPGQPAWDNCCDDSCDGGTHGQLTVHVENAYESENFPDPAPRVHPCRGTLWVASLVVTLVRCVPTAQGRDEAPSADELDIAAAQMEMDRWAVLQALACCLPTAGNVRKRKVQIAGATTLNEEAGCAGFAVRALVDSGVACGCLDNGGS